MNRRTFFTFLAAPFAARFLPDSNRIVSSFSWHRTGDFRPTPGQGEFLGFNSPEAFYGAGAGGGKTEVLLWSALTSALAGRNGLLLTKTYPEAAHGLMERSKLIYPRAGGQYTKHTQTWRFRNGATIHIGAAEDVNRYRSAEYRYLGMDNLGNFSEADYKILRSRVRGEDTRIRVTSNPPIPRWYHLPNEHVLVRVSDLWRTRKFIDTFPYV